MSESASLEIFVCCLKKAPDPLSPSLSTVLLLIRPLLPPSTAKLPSNCVWLKPRCEGNGLPV